MIREDVCRAEDHAAQDRLLQVLAELGFTADDTWHDAPELGLGVTVYRRGDVELSVLRDTWMVDIAGPADSVATVLELLRETH